MSVHSDAAGSAAAAGPGPIVDVAIGYMAAKQLFAANAAGLFAALADGPASLDEIAARTGLPARTALILSDAMLALGLLERAAGGYTNSPSTRRYLSGSGEDVDLRPFLTFLDTVSYPHWLGFGETSRTAKPAPLELGGDRMEVFLGGVMTYNALHATMLARAYDFGAHRRVLDLGGLSGSFLAEALRENPDLTATFVSGGELVGHAEATLAKAGVEDRVEVLTGDPLVDDVPTGFDLVLLEHVVHRFDAEQNRRIVAAAHKAAAPGARLLLLDFFLEPDGDPRLIDTLHAGEYLVIDGTVVYPRTEVEEWLTSAGWQPVDLLELPGSPRVIVA
ncbi:methyltransferase, partial [Streptomyces sp. SID3343]|uniref:methyltransferase n=1 Tax=Streptomyces sp. SID3343 TaxID=2690260 RepID=UPI00136EFB48